MITPERLRAKLIEMKLVDDTGDPCDAGYNSAIAELEDWIESESRPNKPLAYDPNVPLVLCEDGIYRREAT